MLIDESSNCMLLRSDPTHPSSGDPMTTRDPHVYENCEVRDGRIGDSRGRLARSRCLPSEVASADGRQEPRSSASRTTGAHPAITAHPSSQSQPKPLSLHHIQKWLLSSEESSRPWSVRRIVSRSCEAGMSVRANEVSDTARPMWPFYVSGMSQIMSVGRSLRKED